jgi:hypothetical protein
VGIAKIVPDSLTPRRFSSASGATRARQIGTAYGASDGTADTTSATPAATETATVNT